MTQLKDIGATTALHLYAKMLEIRYFEDETQRLFFASLIRGTTHLSQGQEAVTVGACAALRPDDTMVCTYRGHGAVLARDVDPAAAFAEMMGRQGGLCHGKGGSMHLMDVTRGAYGSFAIVGAGLPVANGLALAARFAGNGAVSMAFFGDGATNIGAFHEALNLAAVWALPVVFVCENNLYGEYSPLRSTTPIDRLADRGASYGMPAVRVDGNDVVAMYATSADAVQAAREGRGPTLIEALTYRQGGHSRTDPGKYRPEEEIAEWKARDPITLFAARLESELAVPATQLRAVEADVLARINTARDTAVASPVPAIDEMWSDVYKESEVGAWAS